MSASKLCWNIRIRPSSFSWLCGEKSILFPKSESACRFWKIWRGRGREKGKCPLMVGTLQLGRKMTGDQNDANATSLKLHWKQVAQAYCHNINKWAIITEKGGGGRLCSENVYKCVPVGKLGIHLPSKWTFTGLTSRTGEQGWVGVLKSFHSSPFVLLFSYPVFH